MWVVFAFGRFSCVFVGGGDNFVVCCLLNVQRSILYVVVVCILAYLISFYIAINCCYALKFINNSIGWLFNLMTSTFIHTIKVHKFTSLKRDKWRWQTIAQKIDIKLHILLVH